MVATAIGTTHFFLENFIGDSALLVGVGARNVVFVFFVWIVVWFVAVVAHDDVVSVASLE